MKEYRVVWCQCPTRSHTPRTLFVEAANCLDAEKIARDHIERKQGLEWFQIQSVKESEPMPAGKVVEK